MKLVIALCLSMLAGCSSFKLGAFCYVPHGQDASCDLSSKPAK
jgi:hypothetical protein